MPKRQHALRLRNSPLVHVLAQVVFSPVLSMRDRVPSLQERLRAMGLPRFHEYTFQNVLLGSGSTPDVRTKNRWDFMDRESVAAVSLTDEVLVLQTSAYNTFEPFLELLSHVLRVLGEEAKLAFVERLGLRAIDIVHPQEGEQLSQYLQPGLLGFPFDDLKQASGDRSFRIESIAETSVGGVLAIRCYQLPPGQFLPPDLVPTPLVYPSFLKSLVGAAALDFDHYSAQVLDFDPDLISERLWALHDVTGQAFRKAVTGHAWKVWDPEEIPIP